ncbi:hypothetical protein [Tautonia marina]|uniref:hypothetical protein n=1 Tax=Tautonia marina TaxID=2653855 RepID=UPI00191C6E55|nr:hypothetical protein [Tautonia marina]
MRYVVVLLVAISLAGCAKQQGQNQYRYNEVGQSVLVDFGTIVDVREIDITGRNTGAGATAGALAGGGAGAYVGDGSGQIWAAAGGALAGAIIGAAAEQAAADSKGIEYTVVTEQGKAMTVAQNLNSEDKVLEKGQRVMVQTTGSYQRVLPADHLPEEIKRPKGIKVVD